MDSFSERRMSGLASSSSNSRSCTALDKLSVDGEDMDDLQSEQYPSIRSTYRCIFIGCCKRMLFCRCGLFLQRLIFVGVILATCLTWSGYHQRSVNYWRVASASHWRSLGHHCSHSNITVASGHVNPCWNIGLPLGCSENCRQQTVCAPKVILGGVKGCYNHQLVSSFARAPEAVLVHDRLSIDGQCSLELLSEKYQEGLLGGVDEPTLYLDDPELITSSVFSEDMPLSSKTRWLLPWLTSGSRLVLMLCDPSIRLLRHIQETLVTMEPTKQAVHSFVVTRLNRAQSCIKEHGAKTCQKLDSGADPMYSYLLQGIYLPYMADLRDLLPPEFVLPLYIDYQNSTRFASSMSQVSQVLSVAAASSPTEQELESLRQAGVESLESLMEGMSPQTLDAIQTFYSAYERDMPHILDMYS